MLERGAETRGRFARLLAGTETLEIKATIPQRQIMETRDRYELSTHNDDERFIYFFDTERLDLLRAGIIARARRVVGEEHDSTVKFRPVDPEKVGKRWRKYRGFKIEADASEAAVTPSPRRKRRRPMPCQSVKVINFLPGICFSEIFSRKRVDRLFLPQCFLIDNPFSPMTLN